MDKKPARENEYHDKSPITELNASEGNKKKQEKRDIISPGLIPYIISISILFLSILNLLFNFQFSNNNIDPLLMAFLSILFILIVFGATFSLSFSVSQLESENKRLSQVLNTNEARNRILYELLEEYEDVDKFYKKITDFGAKSLNVKAGIFARVDGNSYNILSSYGVDDIRNKTSTVEFARTCCGITLYAKETIAIENMAGSIFQNHPSCIQYYIQTYIGTSVFIGKKRFGTLNFFDTEKRLIPFTNTDKDFIRLLGKIISIQIEHRQLQEKLKENNEELEWLNKIKIGRELRMIDLKREIENLKK